MPVTSATICCTSRPGNGKVEVGAHPVGAPFGGAEPSGELVGEPALDAAGVHGDDLLRERVGDGLGQEVAEGAAQHVGALGAVQHERHAISPIASTVRDRRDATRRPCLCVRLPACEAPGVPLPEPKSGDVTDLATLLDLEVLDRDLFRGQNEDHGEPRCRSTAARSRRRHCGPRAHGAAPDGCRTRCTATSCGRAASTVP